MLKLLNIQLFGFKSFCDSTVFSFDPGITAVVGPNGCGKSNLLDAISWVLGSQSPKSMRASKMQDVIFNGSRSRKPFGFAEVKLTFTATEEISLKSATKSYLPNVAVGENITITRKSYRSGESEYYINGKSCRLRDILEFFSGTGLGRSHYAIVEQGHIGQILSSKPQERRLIFEEAASISNFKSKVQIAQLKLESANQNLLRLNDIITEVEKQINGLKRQVQKAKRYKRLMEQLRYYRKTFFRTKYLKLKEQLQQLDANLTEQTEKESLTSKAVFEKEVAFKQLQSSIEELEKSLRSCSVLLSQHEVEYERVSNKITYNSTYQEELTSQKFGVEQQLAQTTERSILLEKEKERRAQDLVDVNEELVKIEQELLSLNKSYNEKISQLATLEKNLENQRNQLFAQVSKTESLKNLKLQFEDSLKKLSLQKRQLSSESVKANERKKQLEIERESLKLAQRDLESEIAESKKELTIANEKLKAEQARLAEIESSLSLIGRELARTEDRLGALEQLDKEGKYLEEPVKMLLSNQKLKEQFHILGTLADVLDVEPKNETAVELALKDRLQSILLPSFDHALEATKWLEGKGVGKATFIVVGMYGSESTNLQKIEPTTNFLSILGIKEELKNSITAALPELKDIMIAEDLEKGIELSSLYPSSLIVTQTGQMIRGYYLITGGKNRKASSILQLKREIKELLVKKDGLELEVKACEDRKRLQLPLIQDAEELRQECEVSIKDLEKDLEKNRFELLQNDRELERSQQHLRVIESEYERLVEEESETLKKHQNLDSEIEKANSLKKDLEMTVEETRRQIYELRPHVDEVSQNLTTIKAEIAAKAERRRAISSDVRRLEEDINRLSRRHEIDKLSLAEIDKKRAEAEQEYKDAKIALEKVDAERKRLSNEVERLEKQLVQLKADSQLRNQEIGSLRQTLDRCRDLRSTITADLSKLEAELSHIEQSCLEDFGISIDELLAQPDTVEEFDENLTIEEIKRKIDELGAVNMAAVEELEESEKRLEFLIQQQNDITESIVSTQEAINEINKRSQARFKEVFTAINQHFTEVFKEMFGGGHGELILLNPEDVLESGVEIVAQPPGKRLQNVLLLSGGEKAMVAFSLIVAIMRFRPSPFCIMDEVDAALDEKNIHRIKDQIMRMKENTQIIMITHSKRSMEIADTLYGVTMEEPGVSKVVSVSFV